jgi:uncharacterized protein
LFLPTLGRRKFASSLGLSGALLGADLARARAASVPDSTARDLHAAIRSFPIDDTHCHAITDRDAQTTPDDFLERIALSAMPEAAYFPAGVLQQWRQARGEAKAALNRQYGIEAKLAEIRCHIRESIFIKYLTKELAQFLHCAPRFETVIAARSERCRDYAKYIGDLFRDVNLANAMVDTGFAEGMDAKGFRAFEAAIRPCNMRALARVDTLQAPLLRESISFEELRDRFTASVRSALDGTGNYGFRSWGMKSYLLPRLGLVRPHYDAEAARQSWTEYQQSRNATPADREAAADRGRRLLEYFFTIALEECLQRDMPMQMHAGDGEAPGVILRRQHPYFLEEVARFEKDGVLRMPKLIPIHAGYPLVGEAAWLSHLYTNCYFEISLMNPVIHQGLARRFGEILEAVPLSKVLFGSDAYHLPEFYWLAGRWGKLYLSQALAVYVGSGILTRDEALEGARMILYKNNRRLYNLPT